VSPKPGGWQISSEGGLSPPWRRDGMLVAVPVLEDTSFATGPPQELFSTQAYYSDPNTTAYDVALDGERFLMIKLRDDEMIFVVSWIEEVRRLFESE